MNLYEEFYPMVVEMLTEFGTKATLSGTAPDAAVLAAKRAGRALPKGQQAAGRQTLAVVTPMQVQGDNGRLEMRSIATMLLEPHTGETLTMGSDTWNIGTVTRVAPQGQAIVFMAEVS